MLKRYKVVSIFIIICFLSAFIALYNGITATNKINEQIAAQNEYKYTYSETIMINFNDSKINYEDLKLVVKDIDYSNVFITDLSLYLDQTSVTHYPQIILKQNEKLSVPYKETISKLEENNVIISNKVTKEMVVSSSNKTLKVYARLDDEKYSFLKGTIIIGAKDYFELMEEPFEDNILTLNIASNEKDVYSASEQIKSSIKEKYQNVDFYTLDSTNNENLFRSGITGQSVIFMGLFIFALLNTTIISYYLVFVRKREIAIRKAFGFTNIRIIKMLMKDIGELVILSAFTGIVIQLLIDTVITSNFSINNYITLLLPMLICIVISILVATIVPMKFVLKIDPSEGVKR